MTLNKYQVLDPDESIHSYACMQDLAILVTWGSVSPTQKKEFVDLSWPGIGYDPGHINSKAMRFWTMEI